MKSAALRAQIERAMGPRIVPFAFREPPPVEQIPCGVPEIDALTGGLPRGGLVEIFGAASSGRASLMISLLAQMTAREEVCALVDADDSFDPRSAKTRGVELQRLLWVRCHRLEQAFKASDLLLQSGGFGLVAMDLGSTTPRALRRVPLSFWFRFRRTIEHTPTVLVVFAPEPSARTCASLALRLRLEGARWSVNSSTSPLRHACLFQGLRLSAEVARSRSQRSSAIAPYVRFELFPEKAAQDLKSLNHRGTETQSLKTSAFSVCLCG